MMTNDRQHAAIEDAAVVARGQFSWQQAGRTAGRACGCTVAACAVACSSFGNVERTYKETGNASCAKLPLQPNSHTQQEGNHHDVMHSD